jgi:hypothetical protein
MSLNLPENWKIQQKSPTKCLHLVDHTEVDLCAEEPDVFHVTVLEVAEDVLPVEEVNFTLTRKQAQSQKTSLPGGHPGE